MGVITGSEHKKSTQMCSSPKAAGAAKQMIQEKIATQLPSWRSRVARLMREHGDFKICNVTVEQIYAGIRGVQIQVSDISYVDPTQGLRLRGYTIPELMTLLPKAPGTEYPLVGGLFYLLLVDELPSDEHARAVEEDWKARSQVPDYIFNIIKAMPGDTHPMTLFSQAILALQRESVFSHEYTNGIKKGDYWEAYLEDSFNLTAKLPTIAAYIYNLKYRNGEYIPPDPDMDWAANFATMIGYGDNREYQDLCRLIMVIHSDHEGANVSAHASHLVASALSDVYYACSAGMDGLAGPLHGLANQECLRWLLDVMAIFPELPNRDVFEQFLWEQITAGALIPGYGHAVLRTTDPRFTVQYEFARKYLPEDEVFKLVGLVYDVLPGVLTRYGKVKNPWPNVDAINGALQYHYGVTQFDFYTVLFGVSRILGLTSHAVWSRALGKPIERPKSLTTRLLEEMVSKSVKH
jgi:citrate synthase